MQTDINSARITTIKARIAWLEEEEEQLARTAYSAQQNGYVDEDARLWAEAELAEVRLELLRLKASLKAATTGPGSGRATDPTTAEEIRDMLREVVHSDTAQGLLAHRGHKTLVSLLLSVLRGSPAVEGRPEAAWAPLLPVPAPAEQGPSTTPKCVSASPSPEASPSAQWLCTTAVARLVTRQTKWVLSLGEAAVAAGVARPTGRGTQRRHYRWHPDAGPAWVRAAHRAAKESR